MRRKLIMAAVLTVALFVAFATTVATAPAGTATAVDDEYVMKVLVRGAPLHQANGIWADADGHLYVGTAAGVQIAVLDARNGRVIERLSYGTADDVTMGPTAPSTGRTSWRGRSGGLRPTAP